MPSRVEENSKYTGTKTNISLAHNQLYHLLILFFYCLSKVKGRHLLKTVQLSIAKPKHDAMEQITTSTTKIILALFSSYPNF